MSDEHATTRRPVRVLGIDASLRSTGLGLVEQRPPKLVCAGWHTVRNGRNLSHSQCLKNVYEQVAACIAEARPTQAALEGGFHLKNARTAMLLGQVRGVVIAACAAHEVPVFEYPPRRVKQALVGTGSASKDQVARMVVSLLGLRETPGEDEADALAIAICHLHSSTGRAVLNAQPL